MSPTSKSFSSKFDLESKEAVGDPCDNNRPKRSLWQNTIYMTTVSINYINRSENQIAQNIDYLRNSTRWVFEISGKVRSSHNAGHRSEENSKCVRKEVSNFHFHINSPRVRKKSKLEKKCKYDLQS